MKTNRNNLLNRLLQRASGRFLAGGLALAMILCSPSGWATVITVGGGASVTCPATPTATYTTPPAGVTFANWARGSGVTCSSASDGISGSGFNTADAATSFSGNKYYKIT